jgi:small-conductance mechanosensitive channel
VKVNDVIELNGMVVQEINLRTTTVLTRDDKYIILPNTDLTRNQLLIGPTVISLHDLKSP